MSMQYDVYFKTLKQASAIDGSIHQILLREVEAQVRYRMIDELTSKVRVITTLAADAVEGELV